MKMLVQELNTERTRVMVDSSVAQEHALECHSYGYNDWEFAVTVTVTVTV